METEFMNSWSRLAKHANILIYVSVFFVACGLVRKTVSLPNGYKWEERDSRILIISPVGLVLCEDNITDIMVEGAMIYGWIDVDPYEYFFLDTKTGQFTRIADKKQFVHFIERKNLPILSMRFSYTFWDLASGQRKFGT